MYWLDVCIVTIIVLFCIVSASLLPFPCVIGMVLVVELSSPASFFFLRCWYRLYLCVRVACFCVPEYTIFIAARVYLFLFYVFRLFYVSSCEPEASDGNGAVS